MRTFRCSLILMSFVLLAVDNYADDKSRSPSLELKVSKLKDSNFFPGAKAYSATLTNTTTQSIRLELIKMPEGYSGGGVVYPCATQFWNAKTKQWRTIPPGNTRSGKTVGFFSHWDIKPNETIEVCRKQLEKEWIRGGRCARFAFTFHWDHKPDIISKLFVIPDPDKLDKHIKCPDSQR